ncbi:YuzF family protein [Paenibacillus andongensis]|uniref:YuzF family protein n=1 Tax=Paenibacillus andongensis TaxID=2975482 RepID=UPI0021BA47EE|nr:YuzF family protein [Paenibacillus andongensis]
MMFFNTYIGMMVQIEMMGDRDKIGYLIDVGPDIIVIYMEKKYLYIPIAHIRNITLQADDKMNTESPPAPVKQTGEITYAQILNSAIDRFVEIYISSNQTIHGYVRHIAQDYFVFYSPLYQVMYIPLFHLKWISPYQSNQTPYSQVQSQMAARSSDPTFALLPSTFVQLLKDLEGEIVCFDTGLHANKMGLLQKLNIPFVELITADEKKLHYNIQHIKNCIPFNK